MTAVMNVVSVLESPPIPAIVRNSKSRNIISDNNKSQIIRLYQQNIKPKAIQSQIIPPIKLTTITNIIRNYKKTNSITNNRNKSGRKRKLSADISNSIITDQSNNNDKTLEQLSTDIKTDYNVDISNSSIYRVLKKAKFTTKQLQPIHSARESDRTLILRQEFALNEVLVSQFEQNLTLSIDEAGVQIGKIRKRGRSVRGKPAIGRVPVLNGPKINIIAAISPIYGLLFYSKTTANITARIFSQFLDEMNSKCPQLQQHPHRFLLDNASIHLGSEVREWFADKPHQQLQLPPYSPMLNPIEECFSKWKMGIKKLKSKTIGELNNSIDLISKTITISNCKSWFNHSREQLDNCLAMNKM